MTFYGKYDKINGEFVWKGALALKILIAFVLALFAGALFLPSADHSGIRNLPLLIALLSLVVLIFVVKVFQYLILMRKAKRILREKGFRCVKTVAFPFGAWLRGRYSMTFQNGQNAWDVVLLVRKKHYQHYYFKNINEIEFYRSNRVVFNGGKTRGGTISNLVETKLIGKQKIKWGSSTEGLDGKMMVLFDRLPYKTTDSVKRQELGNGDLIGDSNAYLYDLDGLQDNSL